MVVDGSNLIVDDPELAPVLSGTHLPTSEEWKAELAWQCGEVGRPVGMTSTGNRTRVSRMVAQWFTHYAILFLSHYVWLLSGYALLTSRHFLAQS